MEQSELRLYGVLRSSFAQPRSLINTAVERCACPSKPLPCAFKPQDPRERNTMASAADESNPSELHPAVRIGHVHLRVADLDRATSFYRDVLGFDVTVYGSDQEHVFLSAGSYHQHIALNTWHSKGGHTATGGAHGTAALRHPLPRSARTRQSRRAPPGERLSDRSRAGSRGVDLGVP
jgi:catechol-2,3-dioxygenase